GRERVEFSVGTIAGNIAWYRFIIPFGLTKKAGESFGVTVVGYDPNGNVAYGDDTTQVNLGSSGSAAFSVNPATLSNGSVSLSVSDTVASNALVLWAETSGNGGALSYSDTISILPEAPDGEIRIALIEPDTITANKKSKCSITTQPITDIYGNIVSPGNLITVSPSLGSVASDDVDPLPGFQRATSPSGRVSVFVRSSSVAGVDSVRFEGVEGNALGYAVVIYAPWPACAYDGYLSPGFVVPDSMVQFRCSLVNNSPTGLYISSGSSISFSDSLYNKYEAQLGSAVFIDSYSADTLTFSETPVPTGMLGGTYTPRVSIVGSDIYSSSYSKEFDAGSNSVSVSNIEIVRITPIQLIVSRGD
ncbi:MAG: hypothetical protein KAX38_08065, partial [Candidatus Krumholzibacteria bacterium]|nr:hypothetical protein [Candidatus Krumholzibacteria bacterium]